MIFFPLVPIVAPERRGEEERREINWREREGITAAGTLVLFMLWGGEGERERLDGEGERGERVRLLRVEEEEEREERLILPSSRGKEVDEERFFFVVNFDVGEDDEDLIIADVGVGGVGVVLGGVGVVLGGVGVVGVGIFVMFGDGSRL